ncbi:MAG: sigma-54-dependent Fis family transcriptional regulator [Candidatus Tectomicrobia bacterium]|uniref:Sigma-54-dependent Fis family transcriptional regulator n=1 Tax=Tectimicrobiota bacterium TaxID=2528274 RepID=A0A932CQW0_UNCTE|nr:sigma-54-dependent Fis family transcriptional regulator [Candidatus Tectomicrobia bacterium]
MPILVVDDDAAVRTAMADLLEYAGHSVLTAANGYEALAFVAGTPVEMVIADINMPEMSGLDLLREVKRREPHLPVLVITGHGTIDSAIEAMKAGASDYVLKPFTLELLDSVVKRELAAIQERAQEEGKDGYPLREGKRILTQNPRMKEMLSLAQAVASSTATVLIQGESGTGKELLARFIHQNSPRKSGPFVAINCAALPETLLESELFGHEKGAFTGAIARKKGKFELAHQGTILLDEISEMACSLQAKLLRFLQEGEVDRVGGTHPIPVDVRVIATTNRDIKEAMAQGRFRPDLYYRLNVIPLKIPALRERREDIPLLVAYFVERYNPKGRGTKTRLPEETLSVLKSYEWPGNVRELENVIQRGVLLARGEPLRSHHLFLDGEPLPGLKGESPLKGEAPSFPGSSPGQALVAGMTVRDMERQLIFQTLEQVGGNRMQAARLLGVSIRTLRNKLKEYREGKNCLDPIEEQRIASGS